MTLFDPRVAALESSDISREEIRRQHSLSSLWLDEEGVSMRKCSAIVWVQEGWVFDCPTTL